MVCVQDSCLWVIDVGDFDFRQYLETEQLKCIQFWLSKILLKKCQGFLLSPIAVMMGEELKKIPPGPQYTCTHTSVNA